MVESPCCPRDFQQSSPTSQIRSINSSALSFLYSPTLTSVHGYWKHRSLIRWTFVEKVKSLLINVLSRLVITFLPRSKCLNFVAAVTICSDFGAPENKVSHCFYCFTIYLPWVMGPNTMILVLWMLSFKPTFSFSSFNFIKRLFSSSSLSAVRAVSPAYLRLLIFLLAILIPACNYFLKFSDSLFSSYESTDMD